MKKEGQLKRRAVPISLFIYLVLNLIFSTLSFGQASPNSTQKTLALIGLIPGEYVSQSKNTYALGYVEIRKGVIFRIRTLTPAQVPSVVQSSPIPVINLSRGKTWDVIYPGLIDLHNHTKQNMIPLWGDARGQFANRFEWRAWSAYDKAGSNNWNPWIGYGPSTCAAFRWSELQAMVLGTTYLQGDSSAGCVRDFAINQVEDRSSYISKKLGVQAPTDLIDPASMTFIWHTVRPRMIELVRKGTGRNVRNYQEALSLGMNYETALKSILWEHCPPLRQVIQDVNGTAELKILGNKNSLSKACGIKTKEDEARFPDQFIRYVYWFHKTIAGKKRYLADPRRAAVIGHLAEGRRHDPYNQMEFHLLSILGLDQPFVNLVHGVGVDPAGFAHMGKRGMGLVWSPFSNLLLYGETADILSAARAGVPIALGSDWLPTGSRSVLEELKVAREYVRKAGMSQVFNDEALYRMVTDNPARMINHYETDPNDGDFGIGTIRVGAMGSVIAVRQRVANPYTNLVMAGVEDIELVVVDGEPKYGDPAAIRQALPSAQMELLPDYRVGFGRAGLPPYPAGAGKESLLNHFTSIAKASKSIPLTSVNRCKMESKGLVYQETIGNKDKKPLYDFYRATGVNLDHYEDLYRLLGTNVMTQSRNATNQEGGNSRFALSYFPSLFSCNDPPYLYRITHMVRARGMDEMTQNAAARQSRRAQLGLGSVPKRMAEDYGLTYNPARDY